MIELTDRQLTIWSWALLLLAPLAAVLYASEIDHMGVGLLILAGSVAAGIKLRRSRGRQGAARAAEGGDARSQ